MNKTQRRELKKMQENLLDVKEELTSIQCGMETMRDEESDKYDNLSEGLQESELGERLMEASDTLDDIISTLEDVISSLDDIDSSIEDLL